MKRVNHAADEARRQVVPKDFSFLSDADQDVVRGIGALISAIVGVGADDACVLSGCHLKMARSGTDTTYAVGDGLILYGGSIYAVSGLNSVVVTEQIHTLAGLDLFLNGHWITFGEVTVSPSPVYKYGEQQVSCHEEAKAVSLSDTAGARNSVKLADLKTLPRLGDAIGYMTYNLKTLTNVSTQSEEE